MTKCHILHNFVRFDVCYDDGLWVKRKFHYLKVYFFLPLVMPDICKKKLHCTGERRHMRISLRTCVIISP